MRGTSATMQHGASASPRLGVAIQALLVLAIGLLALAPPSRGLMLLVPLTPGAAAGIEQAVAGTGAALAAPGPFPGSRYVDAERAALLPRALRHGLLLLSGAPRLCTTPSESPRE